MKNKVTFLVIISFTLFLLGSLTSCEKTPSNNGEETLQVNSCEGCHTNYEHLQKIYTADTEGPVSGCGGEAPYYEPYDRVYMGGSGYEAYKKNAHYKIGCTGCHNGKGDTDDKKVAHGGDFIRHPSDFYMEKCGSCHKDIAKNFTTSLHHGTGQKRKVAIRSGLRGPEEFDKLPASHKEGYSKNCATCHGTCGNCHVVRPLSGGGGLANGHNFKKTPDMVTVCVTCHVSRGGHAYLGVAAGTVPDVHYTSLKKVCTDCHGASELHGDGKPVDQRYAYSKLPQCTNCHTKLDNSNSYHSTHINDFNCHVCHSQDYNNCASCHVHGQGARIPAYQGFKIAANPIPGIKSKYPISLVRRTLAAPDNWKEYGVPNYANFNALPTYNYTTPHNIIRWTQRTKVNTGACYSNCHIRNENGKLINRELYLMESDLLDWEKMATQSLVMDKKLPSKWFEKR